MGKKKVLVEGFEFFVRSVDITQDYYGPYASWGGSTVGAQGPQIIRLEAEASSGEYDKKDWGELMSTISAGKVTLVIDK